MTISFQDGLILVGIPTGYETIRIQDLPLLFSIIFLAPLRSNVGMMDGEDDVLKFRILLQPLYGETMLLGDIRRDVAVVHGGIGMRAEPFGDTPAFGFSVGASRKHIGLQPFRDHLLRRLDRLLAIAQICRRILSDDLGPHGGRAGIVGGFLDGLVEFLYDPARRDSSELGVRRPDCGLSAHVYLLAGTCDHGPRRHGEMRHECDYIRPKAGAKVIDQVFGGREVAAGRVQNQVEPLVAVESMDVGHEAFHVGIA